MRRLNEWLTISSPLLLRERPSTTRYMRESQMEPIMAPVLPKK